MSDPRTRTRVKRAFPLLFTGTNSLTGVSTRSYLIGVDRQTTVDSKHPWNWYINALHKQTQASKFLGHVGDMGGDFTSTTKTCDFSKTEVVSLRSSNGSTFKGPLLPARPQTGSLRSDARDAIEEPLFLYAQIDSLDPAHNQQDAWQSVSQTDSELAILGTKLLGSLSPTAPHNSVYTSLGELRNDGLPSIPFLSFLKKGGKLPEKVGGEWLNFQFAIQPTIADVKNIAKTVREADKLWKQYLRDSGRHVRRRMDMDPVITTTSGLIATARADRLPVGTSSGYWSSVGATEYTQTTKTKRWFSACYQYYVDEDSLKGMEGWLERADYLYGWKPDPSAVYNLTAWSWLLDWFTNTGDVIDNISMYLEDPFLTKYAYIMEESSVERTVFQRMVDQTGTLRLAQVTYKTVTKKRRRVSAFHWGLTEDALDARQLSILAALGLTKFSNPGSM